MGPRPILSFLASVVLMGCGDPSAAVIAGGKGPKRNDLLLWAQEIGTDLLKTGLYRFSADGKSARMLDGGAILDVDLSANRQRVVVVHEEYTLVFMDPDGGNRVSLDIPDHLPWDHLPASFTLSPSGRYIAYGAGTDQDNPSIFIARTDGSAATQLFTGSHGAWAWSPVEDKLAYGGDNAPLWIYDAETSVTVKLTDTLARPSSNTPQLWWSPDGERLAFVESLPLGFYLVSDRKSGNEHRLLLDNANWPIEDGSSWSLDSRYFALMQPPGAPVHLRLVDAMGTTKRNIVDAELSLTLGWSPTGHFVYPRYDNSIHSATLSGETLDLAEFGSLYRELAPNGRLAYGEYESPVTTIGADGSNPITYPITAFSSTAALSSDGKYVAFGPTPVGNDIKNVPIFAAASDDVQTTLVLKAMDQAEIVSLKPVGGGSEILFQTKYKAGWILPTEQGFEAIYPDPQLLGILWAQEL